MNSFLYILQNVSGINNKRYLTQPFVFQENYDKFDYIGDKAHIINLMNIIFFKSKECKINNLFSNNAFSKFISLNNILENDFYTIELKQYIFDIFCKSQKHYFSFTRLAYIYKFKKHPYIVTDDLMMNTLDKSHKLTFVLIEDKSNFLFNINEIINIIETAICNSHDFFSKPLWPLNPYNNQPLSYATLYNIYFKMKQMDRVIPLLFHGFFLENFNLDNFCENHESIIREYSIKKYVFNSPYTTLYTSVLNMLRHNEYTNKLTIHKDFPKDLLVNIFRPFLFYYFMENYYIRGTTKVFNYRKLLNIKLYKFYIFNPIFGRQIIKLIKNNNNKIIKRECKFNIKYLPFYHISNSPDLPDLPEINFNTLNERRGNSSDLYINGLRVNNSMVDDFDSDTNNSIQNYYYDDNESLIEEEENSNEEIYNGTEEDEEAIYNDTQENEENTIWRNAFLENSDGEDFNSPD